MATIHPLADVDPALIEQLIDLAFEPERRRRTAYKVREGTEWLPTLSFAALDDEAHLCGTIQCWPVALTDDEGRKHQLIMVGPVAVLPHVQTQGYGTALMLASLAAHNPQAPLPQMMIGDPEYYGRFGFENSCTSGWRLPGPYEPHRLLARCESAGVLPKDGMLGPWRG